MIVASYTKYKIGTIVHMPTYSVDSKGDIVGTTVDQPCQIMAMATVEEWMEACKETCGPPPKDFRPDSGLYYYKISTD